MSDFLRSRIAIERKLERHATADILKKLISSDREGVKVRRWVKKNARQGLAREYNQGGSDIQCSDWEVELCIFADKIAYELSIHPWEIASSKERKNHVEKVAKKARELANALEADISPFCPSAMAFFDEEFSWALMRSMETKTKLRLFRNTKYYRDDEFEINDEGYEFDPYGAASALDFPFLKQRQELSPLLRRLAKWIEEQPEKRPKILRQPSKARLAERYFAKSLAKYFDVFFDVKPAEIILCCVLIKFPDLLDHPPSVDNIRKWIGLK